MKIHKLKNNMVYLCGSMDRAPDGGIGWRRDLTPFLKNYLGCAVLDPSNKPVDDEDLLSIEKPGSRKMREKLLDDGEFDKFSQQIKKIRVLDLRLVDVSDFLITYINNDISSCGTMEEMYWANRMKKPVLIMCEQGKKNIPHWLFGVFPHQMFFSAWQELKNYLIDVDTGLDKNTYNRWVFLNRMKLND